MASAFLRGLKDLAGMTRTTGRVTGSLLSAPLREGNAIGAFARANPARSSIMGLGGALAIGGAGLAGFGPGSFIGDETARYITSKYGDTEESQNLITQTKLFGGTAAAAGLGFIGAGALMKEPAEGALRGFVTRAASKTSSAIAKSSSKIKDALMRYGPNDMRLMHAVRSIPNAPGKLLDLSKKTVDTGFRYAKAGYEASKNAPRYTQGFVRGIFSSDVKNIVSRRDAKLMQTAATRASSRKGRGAPKRRDFKNLKRRDIQNLKRRDVQNLKRREFQNLKEKDVPYRSGLMDAQKLKKDITRPMATATEKLGAIASFPKRHPFMTATAAGFTAGAIMAVETAGLERNAMGGFEGNIIDMGASSGGSISPELQFSTQGLVFALHKNNKNSRSRYQ